MNSKVLHQLFWLVALVTSASLLAEPPVTRRRVIIPATPGASPETTEDKMPARPAPVLALAGYPLTLQVYNTGTKLMDSKGVFRHTLGARESVHSHVVSPAGTAALVCVFREGYYQRLVRIRRINGELKFDEVWPQEARLFGDRRWWVARLGAVSDDGDTLLAEFGIGPEGGVGWMDYEWQTWSIAAPKKLGTGLTIANGILDK